MSDQHPSSLSETSPQKTALWALHKEYGARMVHFAGYEMPIQYPDGILKEHLHCRAAAGLFDVSHMGQARLSTVGGESEEAAKILEALVPGDLLSLKNGEMRYSLLTESSGGILDDFMITRREDHLFLVVNAACKEADFQHISEKLGKKGTLEILQDHGLLALQGPMAVDVLSALAPEVAQLTFMTGMDVQIQNHSCFVTRSGYTGEDGFEISIPNEGVESIARLLLENSHVKFIGLGARDSLRLEAGLCLYGHDIDQTTTPIEAGLTWAVGKQRRPGGLRAGGFAGSDIIIGQMEGTAQRKRIGLKPQGRAPIREGADIQTPEGDVIGTVTSGGFGPSVGGPIAMGYVPIAYAKPGTPLCLMLRGKAISAEVVKMPFIQPSYKR